MITPRFLIGSLLISITMFALRPISALAQPPEVAQPCASPRHGMAPPPERLAFPPPPFLRGLALTEPQKDQIFAVLHAQAPQLRETGRRVQQRSEALRSLSLSDRYDAAQAAEISRDIGLAQGEHARLRSEVDQQIYAVLTLEQRRQLAAKPAPRQELPL